MVIGRLHRAVVLLALVCAGFPSPGEARPCACPDPLDLDAPAGVVWQGRPEGTQLRQLAHLLAPVLWFSSDEPLLVLRQNGAIPHAHPCDRESATPVVYYQATDIVLRGSERVHEPADDEPRFFEKVDHFVLRYFFYYDEDWGLGRHAHDLEVVNVYVYLDETGPGCYRVRVPKVEGLAHGLDWYSNILRVERDTAFPIMILVEEGKHASCPDRNADGIYTPGYDVNVHVNDAWGLRDVLGSSMLLGASYSASMSKPREPRFRLFPPETGLPICPRNGRRTEYDPEHSLGRYHLRPATTVPACRPRVNEPERLAAMTRSHRFGEGWPARQYDSDLEKELTDVTNVTRWISGVNARLEAKRVGIIAQGPGKDLREVWAVPRVFWSTRSWFVDGLFTPSASRWAEWYAAAGYEHLERNAANANGNGEIIRGFASEIGVKFRATLSGKARWAVFGYRFGGLRIGVRAHGISRLREPRLIIELGAGAF